MMDFNAYILVLIYCISFCSTSVSGAKDMKIEYNEPEEDCDEDPSDCNSENCACVIPSNLDCSEYYRCFNGKSIKERCNDGLLFNINTMSCDYERNVDCASSINARTMSTSCSKPTISFETEVPPIRSTDSKSFPPFTNNATNPETTTKDFSTHSPGTKSTFNPSPKLTDFPSTPRKDSSTQSTPNAAKSTTFSSNPTEPLIIDECPEGDGIYSDPLDCRRYYVCTKGIKFHKWCPSNLHFNPSILNCDWQGTAGCAYPVNGTTTNLPHVTSMLTTTTTHSQSCNCDCCILPMDNDCSSFIICIGGVSLQGRCQRGLYFNPVTSSCDLQRNVQCQRYTDCPKQNGRYAIIDRCSSYYTECIRGIKNTRKCPEGLLFDPQKLTCSWTCKDSPSNTTLTTTIAPPTTIQSLTTVTTFNYSDCPCECCFIPDSHDCSSYTMCIDGKGTSERCPEGLVFNPDIENCDFEHNVECPKPFIDPTPISSLCPQDFGLFPHPENCQEFVKCSFGVADVKKCPGILQFNSKLQVCDWPWLAGCRSLYPNPPEPRTIPCGCDSCLIPEESDCSSFIVCIEKKGRTDRCSSGLLFNPDIENCDLAENVRCKYDPEMYCPYPDGLYPFPNDCHKFLHCSHNVPYIKYCPANLHFNSVLKVCDWPEKAGCNGTYPTLDPPPPPPSNPCEVCECCFIPDEEDCSSYTYCEGGSGIKMTCSNGLFFNPDIENCDYADNVHCHGKSPDLCPKSSGLFPDEDCTKFIHCSHGIPHIKNCPGELHFSPSLLVCDWPSRAGCGSEPVHPDKPDEKSCDCDCCFVPHEYQCEKFYLCLNGTSFLKECTNGLVFNPEIENCDYPANADCSIKSSTTLSPICSIPDGLFPNPSNCNTFYHCSNGHPQLKFCPRGLHFSFKSNDCKYPCDAGCDLTIDCSTTFEVATSTPAFRNRTDPPPPSYCKTSNDMFPHPRSCTSYYQCANGFGYLMQCPPGLHFSKYLQRCDYPCLANCDPTLNCPTTRYISTKFPTKATSEVPIIPSLQCKSPNGIFANPESCTSYYQCSNGYGYLVPCPLGLHFSEDLERCDYPCIAKCDPSIDCPTTGYISTKFPTKATSKVPIIPSVQCKSPNGIFAYPKSCSSYYQCSNGYGYLVPCPLGLHFSEDLERCDYPCIAKCDPSIDCPTTSRISTKFPTVVTKATSDVPIILPFQCKSPNGMFANPGSCTSYYQCSNGHSYLILCPFGLHFSENLQRCDYPCISKCDSSIDCPSTIRTTGSASTIDISSTTSNIPITQSICKIPYGIFANPRSCSSYYQCSNGYNYFVPCPTGLHFSENLQRCDYPCIAKCDPRIDCPTTHKVSTKFPTVVTKATSEVPTIPSIQCKRPNGMFANPRSCTSYYHCSNGYGYLVSCPPGLHYSEDLQRCDYPCTAKCDSTIACPTSASISTSLDPDSGSCSCEDCKQPEPLDCSAYYECKNGKIHKQFCPLGMLFSKDTSFCEESSNVDCPSVPDRSYCLESIGMFPMPGKCHQFLHCDAGIPYLKDCPGNLEWDQEQQICDTPKGRCGNHNIDAECLRPSGHFPNPNDCGSFYHCDHGVAYLKQCPSFLFFNYELEMCDWPWNVSCGSVLPTSLPTPDPYECRENPEVQCSCACRVPDYDDCRSFYQCLHDGKSCKKMCPTGLLYNKHNMVCDLPQNVECREQSSFYHL